MNHNLDFIDLSHHINNFTKAFPGDPDTDLREVFTHKNNGFVVNEMSLSTHIATHIDAPYHYFKDGKKINEFGLNQLHGVAILLDLESFFENNLDKIDLNHFNEEEFLKEVEKYSSNVLIIKTGWWKKFNDDDYFTNSPYLSEDLADFIIVNDFKIVALDFPSVDSFNNENSNIIHKKLLKNDILIVENLNNLDSLKEEIYEIFLIPLKLDAEASPIRAFVRKFI